jgi:hypothetical protein
MHAPPVGATVRQRSINPACARGADVPRVVGVSACGRVLKPDPAPGHSTKWVATPNVFPIGTRLANPAISPRLLLVSYGSGLRTRPHGDTPTTRGTSAPRAHEFWRKKGYALARQVHCLPGLGTTLASTRWRRRPPVPSGAEASRFPSRQACSPSLRAYTCQLCSMHALMSQQAGNAMRRVNKRTLGRGKAPADAGYMMSDVKGSSGLARSSASCLLCFPPPAERAAPEVGSWTGKRHPRHFQQMVGNGNDVVGMDCSHVPPEAEAITGTKQSFAPARYHPSIANHIQRRRQRTEARAVPNPGRQRT